MSSSNPPSSNKPNNADAKRKALRTQVEALHAEMEIADYGINEHTGRSKRKVSRHRMKERTIKRLTLEKEDLKDLAVHQTENTTKRLRGSKAAFEDEVIKGSLIFGGSETNDGNGKQYGELEKQGNGNGNGNDNDNDSDDEDYADIGCEGSDDEEEEGRYELYNDELHSLPDDDNDSDNDSNNEEGDETLDGNPNANKKRASRANPNSSPPTDPTHAQKIEAAKKQFPKKKIARTMYRLRNFKSHRMAEKHGDALGSHARGFNRSAVTKLNQVASAAPIAPQVYSSLGLVYESMLSDEMKNKKKEREQKRERLRKAKELGQSGIDGDVDIDVDSDEENGNIFREETETIIACIELASKTFGSYHVAALLCKLDYTLWLRSGDAAMKVADLHSRCLSLPAILDPADDHEKDSDKDSDNDKENDKDDDNNNPAKRQFSTPEEYMKYHKEEKERWLEEAKNDYLAADNIHPPGITVPAKLAHAHMQLGNLSEALTILTDLKKNSSNKKSKDNDKDKDDNNKKDNKNEKMKPRSELERSHTAWLLYADLMLTIGFECSKWNRGEQTNDNYMFRRWLRKYSSSFDWRERRLQSLCLALEAATGTKCCETIVSWMHDRAMGAHNTNDTYDIDLNAQRAKSDSKNTTNKDSEAPDDQLNGEKDDANMDSSKKDGSKLITKRLSLDELTKTFDHEREELLSNNRFELDQFDKHTKELNLSFESQSGLNRMKERDGIAKGHKAAILELAGEYRLKRQILESTNLTERADQQEALQPLPLSASCAAVCDIASQLMKLCLGMDLYSLGRMVATSVSLYFKERAARTNDRMLNLKEFDKRQITASANILQLSKEVYDDLHGENNKSLGDDNSVLYLSDEEDFDTKESGEILKMMNLGVLPPELQVLHGMCLIGEGESNFLAGRLIQAILSLDDMCVDQTQPILDHGASDDISIEVFRRAMMDTLSKPAAFAFVTDLILKMKKEEEWADRLLPMFENYFDEIQNCEEVNVLQINPSALSLFMSTKRNYYVKTLLTTLRMKLFTARKLAGNMGKSDGDMITEASKLAQSIVDTVYHFRTTLLLEMNKRELNNESLEVLKILSGSFQIMSSFLKTSARDDELMLVNILSRLRTAVCWICQATIPNHDDVYSSNTAESTDSWRYFPITSEWQTEELKLLSRRSFNLSVSCNVSAFSGWETSEFDLKLLRRNQGPSFFGVHVKGIQVAGYLTQDEEKQLSSQWKMIGRSLPTLASVDFDHAISKVKQADWYTDAMLSLDSDFKNVPIATMGEDEALKIILLYSDSCLQLANFERDDLKQQCLIKNAMSVILPLSQFSLDQSLWDSNIGTSATKNDGISEWEHFAQNSEAIAAPKPPCRQRLSSTKRSSSRSSSKYYSGDLKKQRSSSPLAKLVKVPVEILLKEWNGKQDFDDSDDDEFIDRRLNRWSQTTSGPATLAMKRVDFTVRKLRQSSTINALQKLSLQVAGALLELVSTKECQNPFLCLHQAAVFASQGSKGGNNDEEFKKPLPEETECTTCEALSILGRADCLRAIHFTDEAIFLCSFIAKVCRLRRDKKSDYTWTPKWRVIAILMYTVGIATDATINSFMHGDARSSALGSWEKEVKAEISRARSDAIALQRAFSHRVYNKRKATSHHVSTNDNDHNEEASYNDDENNLEEDKYDGDDNDDDDNDDDNIVNEEDEYSDENYDDEEYNVDEGDTDNNMNDVEHPSLEGPLQIPCEDFGTDSIMEDLDDDEVDDTDLIEIPIMAEV